jgi:hypothetical protein
MLVWNSKNSDVASELSREPMNSKHVGKIMVKIRTNESMTCQKSGNQSERETCCLASIAT